MRLRAYVSFLQANSPSKRAFDGLAHAERRLRRWLEQPRVTRLRAKRPSLRSHHEREPREARIHRDSKRTALPIERDRHDPYVAASQRSRRRDMASNSAASFMLLAASAKPRPSVLGPLPGPRAGVGAAIAARALARAVTGSWRAVAGTCTSAGTSTTVVSRVSSRTPRTRASTDAWMRTPSVRRRRGSGSTLIERVALLRVREPASAELLESL